MEQKFGSAQKNRQASGSMGENWSPVNYFRSERSRVIKIENSYPLGVTSITDNYRKMKIEKKKLPTTKIN